MNLPQECGTGLWIPLVKTSLGSVSMQTIGIQAFHLPAAVPVASKEVLYCLFGSSRPDALYTMEFTLPNTYLCTHNGQSAWSTNSENMHDKL